MLGDSKAFSGFAVDDAERARQFYGETLGVDTEVADAEQGFLTLHLGGDRDTVIYQKDDFVPATYTILNFPVPHIEAAVDELIKRGVRFEHYDGFEQDERGINRDGPLIAWFKDPAGNVLSVIEQNE
jgi:catechol 2,3-dioxygenase-like lactoylglutathione lyase family enzyme